MAISNNLIAATVEFDPKQYSVLKRECEREVRRLNGEFGMDDALRWQRKCRARKSPMIDQARKEVVSHE